MLNIFIPDLYISSVFDMDLEILKNKGIENIIIDIDNTLSKWGSSKPGPDVCNWVKNVREHGFKICILSNSSNRRIAAYCSEIDVFYVKNVFKPLKYSFINAMNLLCSNASNTCVIGDQIFTDILGGNYCGLFTILVVPIDNNEFFFTKIIRRFERLIINRIKN